jgi:hypothetical protein
MKKILSFAALFCILNVSNVHAQTYVLIGNAQNVTDTSALFQPYIYNNADTGATTVWMKLDSPITDSVGATFHFPPNFSFNFSYTDFICGSTQTYMAGFQNSSGAYYTNLTSVTLAPCTGITPYTKPGPTVTIYPMPVNSTSHVDAPGVTQGTFCLYDANGKIVRSIAFANEACDFDRDGLPDGMYIYMLTDTEHATAAGGMMLIQ